MGSLRSLFTEGDIGRLLNEEDDSLSHESGATGDSLDSQVDRHFADYESSAKQSDDVGEEDAASVDQMEAMDWRDLVKGRLIEAGEGDKDDEGPEDAAPGADAMTLKSRDLMPSTWNLSAMT
jgi:hypothetical protein